MKLTEVDVFDGERRRLAGSQSACVHQAEERGGLPAPHPALARGRYGAEERAHLGFRQPEYMYAETKLCAENLGARTVDEVKEYISRERETGFQYGNEYRSHELVPSFELAD